MKKFSYSTTPETLQEMLFSSIYFAVQSLPYCLTSLAFIFFFLGMRIFFSKINYINSYANVSFELFALTICTSCTCLQAQGFVDNMPLNFKSLTKVIPLVFGKIISVQIIGFLIILLVSHMLVIAAPFLILPYIILLPVAIFNQGSVWDAFKYSWKYVAGNRFMMIYTCMIGYMVYVITKLGLMYILHVSNISYLSPILLLVLLTFFNFMSIILLLIILHNMMLRYESRQASKQ